MMNFNTADLCDENDDIQIAKPIFKSYGKNDKFFGKIRTVAVQDDNSYVKKLVQEKVKGDVMVIDGKGSAKCALLGDNLARIACDNGWSGFIINGSIRDSDIINKISIGIKAINTMPNKSEKKDIGEYGKELNFSDVVFKEGSYVFSDADGIIISDKMILKESETKSNTNLPYKLVTFMKNMNNE
tara:strand:- start:654 stop:1208 length:555 start_codon:yes stop_codon:yes gene_type:complete